MLIASRDKNLTTDCITDRDSKWANTVMLHLQMLNENNFHSMDLLIGLLANFEYK